MLHLNEVFDTVSMIIGMLRPFIYGIMMAFVFNIPMKFFPEKSFRTIWEGGKRRSPLYARC